MKSNRVHHFLTLESFSEKELKAVLKKAHAMKKKPKPYHASLAAKTVALIFDKSSTRTRVSFEVACTQLGARSLFLSRSDLQLGRGETIADTARVLSRYVDAIVIRTYGQSIIEEFSKHSAVPVINALTDLHHPCQILADLMTLEENFKKLKGLNLVYLGDGNNIVNSLAIGAAIFGVNFKVVCPKGYEPDVQVIDQAREIARTSKSKIEVVNEVKGSVKGANAVYTDVWTSMGQEKESAKRLRDLKEYQINESLMSESPKAIFMHCLPAHREEEVTEAVMEGQRSVIWDQAENRLHTQKALLHTLLKSTYQTN